MARIFLTLIVLFLLQSNAQAQVPVPLKLSIERDTFSLLIMNKLKPEDFNTLTSKENDVAVPHTRTCSFRHCFSQPPAH